MNLAYSRLKTFFKKINFKEHSYEDFEKLARRHRIHLTTYKMPENVRGYYSTTKRRIYRKKAIVFNENLSPMERLYVAYHELVHHFLHVSCTITQTFYCKFGELNDSKYDLEADTLALILIIPKWKLYELKHTPPEFIDPFLISILPRREKIYLDFGY